MDTRKLKNEIIRILEDKKARNIEVIKLKDKTVIADFFILATGTSSTHINALSQAVEDGLSKDGLNDIKFEPIKKEGARGGKWAVLDYGDIIVHIFNRETREKYNLEDLWSEK